MALILLKLFLGLLVCVCIFADSYIIVNNNVCIILRLQESYLGKIRLIFNFSKSYFENRLRGVVCLGKDGKCVETSLQGTLAAYWLEGKGSSKMHFSVPIRMTDSSL